MLRKAVSAVPKHGEQARSGSGNNGPGSKIEG